MGRRCHIFILAFPSGGLSAAPARAGFTAIPKANFHAKVYFERRNSLDSPDCSVNPFISLNERLKRKAGVSLLPERLERAPEVAFAYFSKPGSIGSFF